MIFIISSCDIHWVRRDAPDPDTRIIPVKNCLPFDF